MCSSEVMSYISFPLNSSWLHYAYQSRFKPFFYVQTTEKSLFLQIAKMSAYFPWKHTIFVLDLIFQLT